jgi:lycopene cyclase domain-containing protein
VWIGIVVPGVIFLLWDGAFTRMGVWGFNPSYLSGIYIGVLPVEEVLFFVCIPYACVFTYAAFNYLIEKDYLYKSQRAISATLIVMCTFIALLNVYKWYTCTIFGGVAFYLFLLQFVWKVNYLGRFYFCYCVLLIPFLIVNGVLTGSWTDNPVVWYNDAENLNLRITTIPVEDIFYGMLLFVMNVSVFEALKKRSSRLYKPLIARPL